MSKIQYGRACCEAAPRHAEHFNDKVRVWCSECVPLSGHYEFCPDGCSKLLAELGIAASTAKPFDIYEILGRDFLACVAEERVFQDTKWGAIPPRDYPDGTGGPELEAKRDELQKLCDAADKMGMLTWRHIVLEEVFEALAETDPRKIKFELHQVSAVLSAWAKAIDNR